MNGDTTSLPGAPPFVERPAHDWEAEKHGSRLVYDDGTITFFWCVYDVTRVYTFVLCVADLIRSIVRADVYLSKRRQIISVMH